MLSDDKVNIQISGGKLGPTEGGVEILLTGGGLPVMFRRVGFEENDAARERRRLIVADGLNPNAAAV